MGYLILLMAIIAEVIATSALKSSNQFTRLLPSLVAIICYCCAFYSLSVVLRTVPVGIAYSIWSGVGIVLVTIIAAVQHRQNPDVAAITGMTLISVGIVVIHVFSRMAAEPQK